MGTRGSLRGGVKQPGHEADHSPASNAEVKECVELYLHSPNTSSWGGGQLRKSTGTSLPFCNLYASSNIISVIQMGGT